MREISDNLVIIALLSLLAVLVGVVIWLAIAEHNAQTACEDKGGTYESYNCRTIYVPVSTYCGSGCTSTIIVPEESCDHRCVGVRP